MDFSDKNIIKWLEGASNSEINSVDFGIIGFDSGMKIRVYNQSEAELSGYSRDTVMERNLFTEVAPCMNNYMVALKFEEKEELDEILSYILSFKIKPTPVELRLLKSSGVTNNYILVKRK